MMNLLGRFGLVEHQSLRSQVHLREVCQVDFRDLLLRGNLLKINRNFLFHSARCSSSTMTARQHVLAEEERIRETCAGETNRRSSRSRAARGSACRHLAP
jgi:hypothetical protein